MWDTLAGPWAWLAVEGSTLHLQAGTAAVIEYGISMVLVWLVVEGSTLHLQAGTAAVIEYGISMVLVWY